MTEQHLSPTAAQARRLWVGLGCGLAVGLLLMACGGGAPVAQILTFMC